MAAAAREQTQDSGAGATPAFRETAPPTESVFAPVWPELSNLPISQRYCLIRTSH
jgi:hypothetical protein